MGQDPSVIRSELEETRQRVGDEIDALSYKTDVRARTGDYVDDKKQAVKSKLTSAKEAVMGVSGGAKETAGSVGSSVGSAVDSARGSVGSAVESVGSAIPDRQAVANRARGLRGTAEHNPLGLAVGGIALGFVVGTLLPKTQVENERLGQMSDRLMDAARDTAHEAVDRGKQVAQEAVEQSKTAAQEAVGAAVESTKEAARQQGQELGSTLQERAQGATS